MGFTHTPRGGAGGPEVEDLHRIDDLHLVVGEDHEVGPMTSCSAPLNTFLPGHPGQWPETTKWRGRGDVHQHLRMLDATGGIPASHCGARLLCMMKMNLTQVHN